MLAVSEACISQTFPCLALSALALSHRFSGFRSLWPFEFISPRSAPGLLLQSFLLREIGCFFFPDFVRFRSSFRLVSLAATRSCYRVNCLNPVLSTTLQFDFRGLFPLAARSIGSRVSRLQWSMLSWFSILFRGFVSLCCALPILISIGVTPLLRRRLLRFTTCSLLLWLSPQSPACRCWLVPQYAASLRLFFCTLCASYPLTGSLHISFAGSLLPPFRVVASFLLQPLA